MKVAIAAWHLKDRNVGLGRYCQGLIHALGQVDQINEYEILSPVAPSQPPVGKNMRIRKVTVPLFKRRLWEQAAPIVAGPHDILHFPYDAATVWKRTPCIVTIHDVKPLIFKELRSRRNLGRLLSQMLVGEKWAKIDHVITDSDCSRRDLMERVGVPDDRITVVYPGVDANVFRPPESEVSAGAVSSGRPYVLCVSGGDPTKNLETLIDAFAALPSSMRDEHDLVLAGDLRRREDLRTRVAERGIAAQTHFPGLVSDERLVELYQRASLFVFPSRYEGFGLPVLEAMACGCPVVCSNAASLPEVTGDAALLVEPLNTEGFTHGMLTMLADGETKRKFRHRGLGQVARFSWHETARKTVQVYSHLFSNR